MNSPQPAPTFSVAGSAPPPHASQFPAWLPRALGWLWPALMLAPAIVFVLFPRNAAVDAFYPYSLENGEGLCLRWSLRAASGQSLYPPLSAELPFIGFNYPPLYIYLWSLFIKVFGISFTGGRLISAASMTGIGAILYGIARRLGAARGPALAGALTFYCIPFLNITGMLCRTDPLAVFLGLLGLWLFAPDARGEKGDRKDQVGAEDSEGGASEAGEPKSAESESGEKENALGARAALGLYVMALAAFAKQTAIFPAAAAIVWTAISRRRSLGRVALHLGGAGILLHGALMIATRGRYFQWIGPYSSGRYEWGRLQGALRMFLSQGGPALALAAAGAIVFFWKTFTGATTIFALPNGRANAEKPHRDGIPRSSPTVREGLPRSSPTVREGLRPPKSRMVRCCANMRGGLFVIYGAMSLAPMILTAKVGSSSHYLLELSAMCALGAAMFVNSARREESQKPWPSLAVWGLFAAMLAMQIAVHGETLLRLDNYGKTMLARRDEKVTRALKSFGCPILCEEPSYLTLTRCPEYMENPFLYSDLVRRGKISAEPLLGHLRKGFIGAVCLNSNPNEPDSATRDRFAPEILQAIVENYPFVWKASGDRCLCFRSERDRARAERNSLGAPRAGRDDGFIP